jgi:hypothetical protein
VDHVTVVLHFAFLVYAIGGGFLAWRWPKAFWPHLAAVTWMVLIVTDSVDCPLTWIEDWARSRAGEPALSGGFIAGYITGVFYPRRFELFVQLLVFALVLVSWAGFVLHRRAVAADRSGTPR